MGCGAATNKVTPGQDPWVTHAQQVIFDTYGDVVTMEDKNKDLLKFGRSTQVQTTETTIMTLPAGTFNEIYLTDNLITSIISESGADTTTVVVEGHTISGLDLTFVTQEVTLTGQTVVPLGTPLARATRAYASGSVDLVGLISVCEDDTYVTGTPQTDAGVHIQIEAGQNQSEKAATSISSVDYWVITAYGADLLTKAASFADIHLQVRLAGGVFRNHIIDGITNDNAAHVDFKPYFIIPPNSDVRIVGHADQNGREVAGWIQGVLLTSA